MWNVTSKELRWAKLKESDTKNSDKLRGLTQRNKRFMFHAKICLKFVGQCPSTGLKSLYRVLFNNSAYMDQNRVFAFALSIWILNYMTYQKVLMIKKSNSYHANCAISTRPRWMRQNLFLCMNFGDLKDFLYITISQYIYISQGCKIKIFRICQHLQYKLNMDLILPVVCLIKANKNWIEICSVFSWHLQKFGLC